MTGIKNFLDIITNYWTTIIAVIGIVIAVYQKIKVYSGKTDDEKIEIAKKQIKESILKMISDAEVDYEEWNKAGSIKRSQVIKQIFSDYPILSKVVDQDQLIKWIDDAIDDSLKELRKIVKENK